MKFCYYYYSAGIHHVSSVLEHSTSSLSRRTGLGETEICGLVLEVSRVVLTTSPSNALNLYNTGLTQYHWGELHAMLISCVILLYSTQLLCVFIMPYSFGDK